MYNIVNKNVKKYREIAKISKRRMAELLGMEYSQYCKLEAQGDIKGQLILEIALYLKIDPKKLMISGMMAEYEEFQSLK